MKKLMILVWAFLFACNNKSENSESGKDTANIKDITDTSAFDATDRMRDSIQMPTSDTTKIDNDNLGNSPRDDEQ